MFAMTCLRLLVAIIVVPAFAAFLAFAAFSSAASADHSWSNYHWGRKSNPSTLSVGDNVSSTWDSYLRTAASHATYNDWTDSSVLDTPVVTSGKSPRRCRPTSGRVEACSYAYGRNGWLGVAQIWVSGSHITQGTTKVNDTYFNTARYNTPGWKHLVMCQELGHTFGLGHVNETYNTPNLGTCMDYTNDPDGKAADPDQLSNEYPNAHDYKQLETIYNGHADSTSTIRTSAASRMPPAANQIDFNDRREWGRMIRTSRDGRFAIYERDLGIKDGKRHKVITHVIWAK